MRAVTLDDLIFGRTHFGAGSAVIPEQLLNLPDDRLRVTADTVTDVMDHVGDFYIDDLGAKHVAQLRPEWQALACAWDETLIREAGVWRTPTAADRLNEAKAAKRSEVERLRDQKRFTAMPYAFPDTVPGSIDTRDQTSVTHIQALVTTAQVLASGGEVNPILPFRDAENQTHALTPAQMIDLGMAVTQHQSAVYAASWLHKDAIAAVADQAGLDAIDISIGWPT